MKFSTAVVLAASASMAAAYTTADIPACAVPCIKDGAPKVGCEVTDAACQCKKQDDLAAEVIGCISEKCTAEEAMESSKVSASICEDLNSGKTTDASSSSTKTSNSTTSAVSTPVSTPGSSSGSGSTPTPSSTNAAGILQVGGFAVGMSAAMGAVMLLL